MQQTNPGTDTERHAIEDSGITIPVTPSRREREARSFWKRLSFRRNRRSLPSPIDPPSAQAAVSRLNHLDERLAGVESAVQVASERLESRMLQFWEMEEQMGRLSRLVSELETSQRDLAERSRHLSRNVFLLAIVAAAAAGVAVFLGVSPRG